MKRLLAVSLMLTVAAGLFATACTPRSAYRGNAPLPSQLEQIVIGRTTQEQVRAMIGSPSTVSTFDPNVWYYISQRTEQWAFMEPEIVEFRALALQFDDNAVLQEMQQYDLEDMQRVALSEDETRTGGRTPSLLEQLLGNYGRFGTRGATD